LRNGKLVWPRSGRRQRLKNDLIVTLAGAEAEKQIIGYPRPRTDLDDRY
jgi:hypothetical protein